MWNQRPQGVEETARILHKRLSAGEGKRPSGPGPAMYSVKSHGLPGNKRGTQDIQEGDYPLKITFCGSSVLEPVRDTASSGLAAARYLVYHSPH